MRLLLLLLLLPLAASAQSAPAGDQEKIGLSILDAILHERTAEAVEMLHPELKKKVGADWVPNVGGVLRTMRSLGGFTPEFSRLAVTMKYDQMGRPTGFTHVYTFKSDTSYPPRFTMTIVFPDTRSTEIIGVMLNDFLPSRSASRQPALSLTHADRDMSGQEGWLVGEDSVAVDGVTLVTTTGSSSEVIMVIKVIRDMSAASDVEASAQAAAVPIVRYALAHGYRQRATDYMLAYPDMKLADNIYVAFFTPGTVRMYRTFVTPDDYNRKPDTPLD
jgi:hypothetical protein